jgi:hypothetical protein
MKARIIIVNGQVSVFVEEGTFEEGKTAIADLYAQLGAAGIQFDTVSAVERHRHDGETKVQAHIHAGGQHG